MEKITIENFNNSLGKNILDRLVQASATTYAVRDSKGIESVEYKECRNYKQAIWDIFRDEILEKLNEEELTIFFNYENARYEAFSQKEDVNSQNVASASNDMRFNFADKINKLQQPNSTYTNLNEVVDELSVKSR